MCVVFVVGGGIVVVSVVVVFDAVVVVLFLRESQFQLRTTKNAEPVRWF